MATVNVLFPEIIIARVVLLDVFSFYLRLQYYTIWPPHRYNQSISFRALDD